MDLIFGIALSTRVRLWKPSALGRRYSRVFSGIGMVVISGSKGARGDQASRWVVVRSGEPVFSYICHCVTLVATMS